MLKRTTKIISLLVAASAIISLVPAMAADVKKFPAEEATVYNAVAGGDGGFYLDADLNNDGNEAIYVYRDGKFTILDGTESGDTINWTVTINGTTYLRLNDGEDYINLKTKKRTDEDIEGNANDDAILAVRRAIKADNEGRFDKVYYNNVDNVKVYMGLLGPQGVWRDFHYKLKTADLYGDQYSSVYSDDKGNYVDADYSLGNVGVYTTGAAITIKNTEDTYELKGTDGKTYEIKATINNDNPMEECLDCINRTADLSIWGREKGSGVDYENITDQVDFGSKSNHHKQVINGSGDTKSVTVLQRFSKAQASDDIDGIKYPKDVKTYFMTDKDGTAVHLLGRSDSANSDVDGTGYGTMFTGPLGYLVSTYRSSAKNKVYAEAINFKSENGYFYLDVDDSDSVSVDSLDESTIALGEIFVLTNDGYVEMFNGKSSSFEKLYKVDGGMNKINVGYIPAVVVWNEDDGIYSIINIGTSSEDKTATATPTTDTTTKAAVTIGWGKAADGTWTYIKADGTKATGWLQDGANWYYLKVDGIMATGWQNIGGNWYYLNISGEMKTGWINDSGTWYYCNTLGVMLSNTIVDGYKLGSNGAWVK